MVGSGPHQEKKMTLKDDSCFYFLPVHQRIAYVSPAPDHIRPSSIDDMAILQATSLHLNQKQLVPLLPRYFAIHGTFIYISFNNLPKFPNHMWIVQGDGRVPLLKTQIIKLIKSLGKIGYVLCLSFFFLGDEQTRSHYLKVCTE